MKLKAKNLRIGNWLYHKKLKGNIVFKSFYALCNVENNIDDYEPIPLTKKWLIKFGCWNTPINKKLFSCGMLSLYLEGDGDVTVNRRGNVNERCYLTTLKYVHELQNLFFAITGEELELTEKSAEL